MEKLKLYKEHTLMDTDDDQVFVAQETKTDQSNGRKFTCWYCNKEGNIQKDCFKRQNDMKNGNTSFRQRKKPFT